MTSLLPYLGFFLSTSRSCSSYYCTFIISIGEDLVNLQYKSLGGFQEAVVYYSSGWSLAELEQGQGYCQ